MTRTGIRVLIIIAIQIAGLSLMAGEPVRQWTHFRGSALVAIVEDGEYPVHWSQAEGVAWKTEIHGRGWSSPVVYGDQVWLTTAPADGHALYAVCIDFESGKVIHDIRVFEPDTVKSIHDVNSYATPTPAIEDGYVYVHFGKYGTACIRTDTGELVWTWDEIRCAHVQGPGSSVILHKEMLILHLEGTDVQWIVALDKHTGREVWRTHRQEAFYAHLAPIGKKAYITPIVMEVDGRELLISNGSAVCNAFDVNTGEEVWHIAQGEDSTISMPFHEHGTLYFYTSFVSPAEGSSYCELFAVDPNGQGDISGNILWRVQSPILQLLTPVVKDGLIYTVDSRSLLICIDALTGETVWSEQLRGKYNASPIWANGLVYISSTRGETLVVRAGKTYDLVAENRLDGEIWATPAFVAGSVLLRTSSYLYKLTGDK
jgi:outer membrane protein assembly factor BamB